MPPQEHLFRTHTQIFRCMNYFTGMVASYYLTKPAYSIVWHLLKLFRTRKKIVLYCDDAFDVTLFKNIQKHLPPIPIIAKNKKVKRDIEHLGYACEGTLPSFPDAVIMFRNMAWKFPCNSIIRIGLEHGAYNFKKFSKAHYYNMLDVFFMTSSHDVSRVRKIGVTTALAIGYPKIDSAFDGSITRASLKELSHSLALDPEKKTVLFSATWDGSGMSAVERWYNRIQELSAEFNLLATLHPWVGRTFKEHLLSLSGIHFITDNEILKYIMLSDVCVGDTNSLIAEFCLLKKPIITFRVPDTPRTLPDVIEMIERISFRVDTFDELKITLRKIVAAPETTTTGLDAAITCFFDTPDGQAGTRAAEHIRKLCHFISI